MSLAVGRCSGAWAAASIANIVTRAFREKPSYDVARKRPGPGWGDSLREMGYGDGRPSAQSAPQIFLKALVEVEI
jgi:hypothetical protein